MSSTLSPWLAHYTTHYAGQAAPSVGSALYVSDSDLSKLDAKVMAEALAVDAAVSQCPALSASDQMSWAQTFAGWKVEHAIVAQALSSSILGLGNAQMVADLTSLQTAILGMQNRVHAACPKVIGSTEGTSLDWGSVVVISAVAVAAALGLWALSPVLVAAIVSRRRAY